MSVAFTKAMKDFFGYQAGKGASGFVAELKALSYEEKLKFAEMLREGGMPCDDPVKPVK